MYFYRNIKGNKDDESLEEITESCVTYAEFPFTYFERIWKLTCWKCSRMMQDSRTKVISYSPEEPAAQLEPEGGVEAVGGVEVGAEGPLPDQIKTMILL